MQRISFPPAHPGGTISTMGLMLDRPADNISTDTIPDGQAVTAVYHAGSFSGSWPSMMEITVRTELAERTLDLTVTEQNTGQVADAGGRGVASGLRAGGRSRGCADRHSVDHEG